MCTRHVANHGRPNHGPSFDSNLGPEPEQVWNASGTATSAPEKDCANYAHCCWHNLILPHSSQPYPLARYVTHWTLVLELLYLWLAVYSTYMDMAIYDTKVPDGVGKATPWFISVTSASGAGRLALCRPVVRPQGPGGPARAYRYRLALRRPYRYR